MNFGQCVSANEFQDNYFMQKLHQISYTYMAFFQWESLNGFQDYLCLQKSYYNGYIYMASLHCVFSDAL